MSRYTYIFKNSWLHNTNIHIGKAALVKCTRLLYASVSQLHVMSTNLALAMAAVWTHYLPRILN